MTEPPVEPPDPLPDVSTAGKEEHSLEASAPNELATSKGAEDQVEGSSTIKEANGRTPSNVKKVPISPSTPQNTSVPSPSRPFTFTAKLQSTLRRIETQNPRIFKEYGGKRC